VYYEYYAGYFTVILSFLAFCFCSAYFIYLVPCRFPRGTYNKLKMKNIGPCRFMKKFGANAYEIELPNGIRISLIFNVVDLYPYRDEEVGAENEQTKVQWNKQMPVAENP
jgi:hypothetical protein